MGRRVLLLVVAVVVAVVGVGLLYLYVQGAEERATETRDVWVALEPVPAGTPVATLVGQTTRVQVTAVPVAAVLPGALAGDVSLTDERLADLVTTRDLLEGEQLVEDRLGPPGNSPEALAGATRTGDGEGEDLDRLLGTFEFSDPERVAGFLQPNSRVAVFYTSTTSGGAEKVTSVVLPSVGVAAVGNVTVSPEVAVIDGQQETTEVAQALVTLRLTPKEMTTLITAQATGELYLGLLPGELQVAGDTRTSQGELLGTGALDPADGQDGDAAP